MCYMPVQGGVLVDQEQENNFAKFGAYGNFFADCESARTAEKPPQRLWHYTTTETVMSMLSTDAERGGGGLYATHREYLNDSSEIHYAVGLCQKQLQTFEKTSSGDFAEVLKAVRRNFETQYMNAFVACFSEAKDDLGQWRAYSKHNGYSVEFITDQSMMDRIELGLDKTLKFGQDYHLLFSRVHYDVSVQNKRVEDAIRCAQGWYAQYPSHQKEYGWFQFSDTLSLWLMRECLSFKNPCFAHEREWRIVLTWHQGSGETKKPPTKIHYRKGLYGVTPYVILEAGVKEDKEGKVRRLPINSITAAPGHTDASEHLGLMMMLEDQGFAVGVLPSKLPARL